MTAIQTTETQLQDRGSDEDAFLDDVLHGLRQSQKSLPCKYLYDRRGSQLFDQICQLPEYYITRTEMLILRRHVKEIASILGPNCLLIEYGSGSSLKTKLLLEHLVDLAAYVPVDISRKHLLETAAGIKNDYHSLEVLPICTDFTRPFEVPSCLRPVDRRVIYFPGSTIGNFNPPQAIALLKSIAELSDGGGLLIGVDLKKDPAVLERAYNDSRGITASFNLNVLHHINRVLGADFEVDAFRHRAMYNPERGRVEMHLFSMMDQQVKLDDETVVFTRGESIHTESSHKYSLEDFRDMAAAVGMTVENVWLDDESLFSIQYLVVKTPATR